MAFNPQYQDVSVNGLMLERQKQQNALNKQLEEIKWYGQNVESEINNRNALTNKYNTLTPLEAEHQRQENFWYPKETQSRIELNRMGGRGGLGVGDKAELTFQGLVGKDNPQLGNDPNKIYAASNALRRGLDVLPDGTKINPLSPASEEALNRLVKYGTTAGLVTQGVRANQAEAEIQTMNKYAQEGLKNYGDTSIFNMSPKQIQDTFKSDDASQERLGKLIAAQALQFEIAQLRFRLSGAPPGITATQELLDTSQQRIRTAFPQLSYKARKAASDQLDKALSEALKSRKSVGIGAASTIGQKKETHEDPLGLL